MVDGSGTRPPGPDEERAAEDDVLRASLHGLSILGSNRLPLEQLLTRVAELAVQAIPRADGAGLTLLEEERSNTVVTTAPFVAELDRVQDRLGEGPCLLAARQGATVISGSLTADDRWRRFAGAVAPMAVHSVLSLPLRTPQGVVGAMNVYAHAGDVFDERAAELGEIFAAPAAIAVQNAQVLADARRLAAQLQATLDTRMVIERAVGIVMSRSGVDADEAFARLQVLSHHQHSRLVVIAQNIIEEAVRRARARQRR